MIRRTSEIRSVIGIFLLTFSLCGLFAGGHVYVRDGAAMYLMAQSVVNHGGFDVPDSHPNTVGGRYGPDGRYYMPFGFLQPLLSTPFILAGRLAAEATDTRYMVFFCVTIFNWCVTAGLAAAVFKGFMALGVRRSRAVLAGLTVIFSTPFWVYSQTFFAEPLTALLSVLAWQLMVRYKYTGTRRFLIASGTVAGAVAWVRPLGGIILPVLALYFLLILKDRSTRISGNRIPADLTAFLVPVATGLAGILAYNQLRFGHVLETGYDRLPDGSFRSFTLDPLTGLNILLFSPGKSVFVFAPLLILAPFAIIRAFTQKSRRRDVLFFAVLSLLYLIVLSSWARVEGGVSWGPRLLLPAIPFLWFTLGDLFNTRRRPLQILLATLLITGIVIQFSGVMVNFSTYVYRHIESYFSPVNGRYVFSFNPIAGHFRHLSRTVTDPAGYARRPPDQAAWNRQTDQINPMDGLDLWWIQFYRDGVRMDFIVTVFAFLCLTGVTGSLLLRVHYKRR